MWSTNIDPGTPRARGVRYSVKVGNISAQAVDGVTVSLLLPTGLQFHYADDSEPNTACGAYVCGANNQATWALGTLAAGEEQHDPRQRDRLEHSSPTAAPSSTSFKLAATNFNTVSFTKTVQVRAQSASQLATGSATYPLTAGQRFTLDLDLGQLGIGGAREHDPRGHPAAGIDGRVHQRRRNAGDGGWTGRLDHRQRRGGRRAPPAARRHRRRERACRRAPQDARDAGVRWRSRARRGGRVHPRRGRRDASARRFGHGDSEPGGARRTARLSTDHHQPRDEGHRRHRRVQPGVARPVLPLRQR